MSPRPSPLALKESSLQDGSPGRTKAVISMGRGTGRGLAVVGLSAEERAFREAPVRRPRVARAVGSRPPEPAGRGRAGQQGGGRSTRQARAPRRPVAQAFRQGPPRGAGGRAPSGAPAAQRGREGGGSDGAQAHLDACGRAALVAALEGAGGGAGAHGAPAPLGRLGPAAAPG